MRQGTILISALAAENYKHLKIDDAGAKQAAEKGLNVGEILEKQPAGAEAHVHFAALTARLKSCPDASCLFE